MVEIRTTGKRVRIIGTVLFVTAIFLATFFLLTADAYPQGIQAASTIVDEDYTVELNGVGDAHITDVLKYDKAWFNSNADTFEKYPFLLSRRYEDESNSRELENFTSSVDRSSYTVTLNFDIPGDAYNKGDYWVLYGYADKPKFENQGQFIFESEGTLNNEFTLWSDMHINNTTTIKPPPGALNARYDPSQKGVVYELPYVPPSSNPLASNKALFTALFAVLMLLGLSGAVFFMTRKTVAPVAAPFTPGIPAPSEGRAPIPVPTSPVTPPAAATISSAPAEVSQPPSPAAGEAPPGEEAEQASKFCKFCGSELKHAGARFCSSCGKEQA
jgi:hypothetical protein